MVNSEFDKYQQVSQVSNEDGGVKYTFEHIITAGNALILALEDMIEFLGGSDKYSSSISKQSSRNFSISDIRDKIAHVKRLLNNFVLITKLSAANR